MKRENYYQEAWGLGPAKGPGSSGISGAMWWYFEHFTDHQIIFLGNFFRQKTYNIVFRMLGSCAVYYEGKSFVEQAKRAWDQYREAWGLGPDNGPEALGYQVLCGGI